VVGPRPLGLGGTIAALTVAGVPVEVVSVSDGGAAYAGLSAVAVAALRAPIGGCARPDGVTK
jgi:LmbE family N-acetylglucosaminyl deacetylase